MHGSWKQRRLLTAVCSAYSTKQLQGYHIIIILADHGNADCADQPDGSPNTAHTKIGTCILISQKPYGINSGRLCDIAPTILKLMELPAPAVMTGQKSTRRVIAHQHNFSAFWNSDFRGAAGFLVVPTFAISVEDLKTGHHPLLILKSTPIHWMTFALRKSDSALMNGSTWIIRSRILVFSPGWKKSTLQTGAKPPVIIELDKEEQLRDNTTYTIFFWEKHWDITQKKMSPKIYLFSTGPVLDSLTLEGTVVDALSQQKEYTYTSLTLWLVAGQRLCHRQP